MKRFTKRTKEGYAYIASMEGASKEEQALDGSYRAVSGVIGVINELARLEDEQFEQRAVEAEKRVIVLEAQIEAALKIIENVKTNAGETYKFDPLDVWPVFRSIEICFGR